jgi:hypothetical protein
MTGPPSQRRRGGPGLNPGTPTAEQTAAAAKQHDPGQRNADARQRQESPAVRLGVLISTLPADDELVVAVRLGLELLDAREHRRAMREAGADISVEAARRGEFRRDHIPHDELRRRRAVPGPLASREGAA